MRARRLVTALAAALAGAAHAAPLPEAGYGLPRDVSAEGHRVDDLMYFTLVSTAIVFVVVAAVLLVALVRHRRTHAAVYQRGNKASIGIALGFVGLILVAVDAPLFIHTLIDMRKIFWNFAAAEARPDVLRLEVQARQWAWQARYAGPDGKFNSEDDVVTLNDIRVPVGSPVVIQLASVDVIHSLNLPNLRVKSDAVPGDITRMTFEARVPGEYEIACAQHCGPNHYKMRGVLTVLPPEGYRAWLRTAQEDARRAYDPDDAEAHWGWEWRTE